MTGLTLDAFQLGRFRAMTSPPAAQREDLATVEFNPFSYRDREHAAFVPVAVAAVLRRHAANGTPTNTTCCAVYYFTSHTSRYY